MRKFPLYLSVTFLALTGVFAFGQEAPSAQPVQPTPAVAPAQPAPAATAAPAPTTAPAQPAAVPAQPAPQPAPQPVAQPVQPAPAAQATEQPAPAAVTPQAPAQPAAAPAQPAKAIQADSTAATQSAEKPVFTPEPTPVKPAPVQANETPRETYVQGYGKPPQGFFGYYGYAPCENKECACANGDSANAEPTVKKKKKKKTAQAPEEEEEEQKKEKKSKILHSFHVSIPIESEQYEFKKDRFDADASYFGVGGSWNRIRLDESLYSSVVGIGINHVTTELDGGGSRNIKYGGIDVNLKFGFGIAPSMDNFILAFHVFFAFDYKMQQAIFKKDMKEMLFDDDDYAFIDYDALDGIDMTYKLNHTIHVLDIQLGGDLILGYQVNDYFGFLAGVDISSNMFGGGVLMAKYEAPDALDYLNQYGSYNGNSNYDEEDLEHDDEINPILYHVTGLNIVPRIGIFFAF